MEGQDKKGRISEGLANVNCNLSPYEGKAEQQNVGDMQKPVEEGWVLTMLGAKYVAFVPSHDFRFTQKAHNNVKY